ncbi:GFA family protein [Allorhizobium undicola]|uniref:GFA family protein n=1 Tax=Allorhizobium undicola TaxID=78527 RepID=UPI000488B0E8|nr:GFA family protein [Allorhizobium undicola]
MQFYTGGCQCGAVRFRLHGKPRDVSICHCRMCQKAFGNYFAPFVACHPADVEWTRGAPKQFASSNFVTRGFCGDCGTPLTYEAPDGLSLAAGAFDDPATLPPTLQYGTEGKLPFTDHLSRLPGHHTDFDIESAPFLADIVSNQHPDEEMPFWRGSLSQPGDE